MERDINVNLGNLLLSLSEITDIANPEIKNHQMKTAYIALEIAKFSDVDDNTMEDIFAAALLHDVGAISVEEKTLLHEIKDVFKRPDTEFHCVRGELLLNSTPWFKNISRIIRYHHTDYKDFNDTIEVKYVLGSQIVYLSDFVERLVDRSKFILFQHEEIRKVISYLDKTIIHPRVVKSFLEASKREEFWLDLVSAKLPIYLEKNGPYRGRQIGIEQISEVSEMYKNVIDFKSPYTASHSSGVARCAELLAQKFGLTSLDCKLIKVAGNLHDLGKLIIPNSIIEKPEKLTNEEFNIMRSHTYYTYHAINTIGGLEGISPMAAYHHEKLDGSGYPFHLKGEQLGIGSRIIAVADIFTAITEDRPYRRGMNRLQSSNILYNEVKNNRVDKTIVEILLDNYDEIHDEVKVVQSNTKHFYEQDFFRNVPMTF